MRERLLLFRVGSGTDWQRAGVTGETVTALVAKGLLVRDGAGRLTLTDDGRAALQALLPGLLVLTLPRLSCWEEIDMALGTVNKLIGNAIELAGIGLALVGIAVASYQCVLRLQDGDWMPLEFRLASPKLGRVGPIPEVADPCRDMGSRLTSELPSGLCKTRALTPISIPFAGKHCKIKL